MTVTLRPLSSDSSPLVSRSTTCCLRTCVTDMSSAGGGLHAELGRAHRPVHLGRLQELLGRDAAAVQAGATDPALFDHGDVETRRGAVQRSVAARSATQHDEIESASVTVGHLFARSLREVPSQGLVSCASVGEDRHLDRERHEDRQPGDGGEDQQRSGTHACNGTCP
jgi:hypothetical protein